MTDSITIRRPFDSHVHLRQGAMLRAVTPITAQKFFSAIVMPNTDPPIDTTEAAAAYKEEIMAAVPEGSTFEPLMTFYLTKNLSPAEIAKGFSGEASAKVYAVKSYPYGATTNSQWGYRSILEAKDVLREMERVGMPLMLHGEVHLNDHDEEEDPYEGERLFVEDTLPRLLDAFPRLKISLEHMSTAIAADFIEKNGAEGKLVATITPTHLLYDRRQAFSGGYRTLIHMKPLVKRREDRERVRALAQRGLPFVSAGSDSAPHPESKKFSSCVTFGVFCSPAALEMYTGVFDELGALDKLENFLSINGPRFYGIQPSEERITLIKKDWQVTEPVITSEGVKVWPIGHVQHGLGNEVIRWQVKR
ncbi:MAG: dihydroorotase [Candidatus Kaiserbacteria bacterium]|nr:MAG: dihydroorotase [Candidatus Kaiserbacteria bacterium]